MADGDIVQVGMEEPDFSNILGSEGLTMRAKRNAILEKLGQKKTRRIYKSPEERKAAAEKRRLERKKERDEVLGKYGIAPKTKGPKKTLEEKRAKRKERGKARRGFLRDMARANPKVAKEFGIDITRFKL